MESSKSALTQGLGFEILFVSPLYYIHILTNKIPKIYF